MEIRQGGPHEAHVGVGESDKGGVPDHYDEECHIGKVQGKSQSELKQLI